MNINTLCNNYQESLSKKYDLILKSNGCFQTITTATRITTCSKTLLDHIITNESELQITPGVFNCQISDHSLTFVMLKNRGGVEDTRLEAKAKDTKKIRGQSQGQPFPGQTLSRPKTGMLEAKDTAASVLQTKNIGLQKSFSGNHQFIGVARIFDWGGLNHKSHAMTSSKICLFFT